jgi:hypothetical protein
VKFGAGMSIGAFLQKRRQIRHGESVLCLLVVILTAAILLPMLLTACGKTGRDGEKETVQKSEDDF